MVAMVEEDRIRIDGEAFYADHIRRRGRWRVSQWTYQFSRVMTHGPQPNHHIMFVANDEDDTN